MQMPDKKILDKFGIDFTSIIPYREGYMLSLQDDRFFLRKADYSLDRLMYIHRAKEHLKAKGFMNMDKYVLSKDGEPYASLNDTLYVMTSVPGGRECNLNQRGDIQKASRELARLHRASAGFVGGTGTETKSELYKIPLYFTKRLEELKKLKKLAKKGNKEFDSIFLRYSDVFFDVAERAIYMLQVSQYQSLCKKAEKEGMFCHHDFTHSNILINEEYANIINFDFICPELKIYDLTNFLRRKLRKCNWDFEEGKFIIDEYMSVHSLNEEELRVMGIMLMFPQKMWRVCNRYYNSRRSFYEKGYIVQLREVIDEIEPSRSFIGKYEKEYY